MRDAPIKIPFSPPDISDLEIQKVTEVLRSGWITTGPKTKEFEKIIANFCGNLRCACLNSATACLEMTLRVLGVGPGDEVITSAYTYSASCSVICHVGATPILVDVEKDTVYMDMERLEQSITAKTKAIICVDIGGILCDYDKIFEIVNHKKNIFTPKTDLQKKIDRIAIIADSAHSFGAKRDGKISGSIADFTAFSFHAVKNLTTAEGGAVTWKSIPGVSDDEIYRNFMTLSLHGQTKDALEKTRVGNWEYDIVLPAYKCNMTDIFAAIGIAQFQRFKDLENRRKKIVSIYNESLSGENLYLLQKTEKNIESSNHLYMIRLLGKTEKFRNEVIAKLAEKGIAANVHYKPLPLLTAYKNLGFSIENFKNAYEFYLNEITLPLHTLLTDDDILYISEAFKSLIL